jgi:hypothetical protein
MRRAGKISRTAFARAEKSVASRSAPGSMLTMAFAVTRTEAGRCVCAVATGWAPLTMRININNTASMVRYPLLAVNVVALMFLAACSTQPCGPSTCVGGCCTANGCAAGETCPVGVCLAGGAGGGSGGGGMDMPRCTTPTTVTCQDESIMQLALRTVVNPDPLVEEGTAPDFKTRIDGRAGGLNPTTSYQYLTFTNTGAQKVMIDDETAFTSLDWDLAVRRYVLRINNGVAGPGCTEVARTAPGTMYDAVTQAPAGLTWRTEEYFTAAPGCTFVPDPSGLPGGPGTAMSSFWTYMNCVQMTGNVYVLHLRNGRYIKLQVLSYYTPQAQMNCDATGNASPTPNEAAVVRIRWGFIGAPP